MDNTFAAVFNTQTKTFQNQTNLAELKLYEVPDATQSQLDRLNKEFQAAYAKGNLKACKALHQGKFASVHCFAPFLDGVASPGQVLADVLDLAYDSDGELIDLDS